MPQPQGRFEGAPSSRRTASHEATALTGLGAMTGVRVDALQHSPPSAEQPPHPLEGRLADDPNASVPTPAGMPHPASEITLTE